MIRMTFLADDELLEVVPHPVSDRMNWAITTNAIVDLILLILFNINNPSKDEFNNNAIHKYQMTHCNGVPNP